MIFFFLDAPPLSTTLQEAPPVEDPAPTPSVAMKQQMQEFASILFFLLRESICCGGLAASSCNESFFWA
jgi:hypothetical protein